MFIMCKIGILKSNEIISKLEFEDLPQVLMKEDEMMVVVLLLQSEKALDQVL
jgi:hypothetical protein